MNRKTCAYRVEELAGCKLPDFPILAHPTSRWDLINAIRTLDIAVLVMDLDEAGAVETIIEAVEVVPTLGVVGVTSSKDLEHALAAQRAGCKQIVMRPLDLDDLVLAMRRVLNEPISSRGRGRTVAVMGASGGAGATTVAVHLAHEIAALTKAKVALFDLDFDFGTTALALNVKPAFTCADVASAGVVDPFLLEKAAFDVGGGVHLFARPASIAEPHGIHDEVVRSMLRTAAQVYGHVVIDLPHRLDPTSGAAIELSTNLMIVLQLTVPSVYNARRLLDTLVAERVAAEGIEFVVNRYRKNVHTCTIEHVASELRKTPISIVPSDFKAARDAIDVGQPISAGNPVRAAIAELAAKVVGNAAAPVRAGGWISRVFGGKKSEAPKS